MQRRLSAKLNIILIITGLFILLLTQWQGVAAQSAPAHSQNIEFLGHIGGIVNAVSVVGNYAYIGEGASFTILDISNPITPIVVGNIPFMPNYIQDITVVGNTAYVADAEGGLRLINVTNPAVPIEIGVYKTARWASAIYVVGNNAFIADDSDGLYILNITTPISPTFVGLYQTESGGASNVFVKDNIAYVTHGGGMDIVNIANPATPVKLGGYYPNLDTTEDVIVVGTLAYVIDFEFGLRVVDVSNPANPVEIGFYEPGSDTYSLFIDGNIAYVTNTNAGVQLVNIAVPTKPTAISVFDTPGRAQNVFVANHKLYVADGAGGLRIADVTNPASPTALGKYCVSVSAQGVFVSENRAYVADGDNGLRIIDVTNPAHLQMLGGYIPPERTDKVYQQNGTAYLAGGYGRVLRMVDIGGQPPRLIEQGFYNTPGWVLDVFVVGNWAYVADEYSGLRVLNVSNLAAPFEKGFYDTPGEASDVYVIGNTAYVADGSSGLQIIDVNPAAASPTLIGTYDTQGNAGDVFVNSSTAYIADGDALRLVNVSNRANPTEMGFYKTPSTIQDVFVVGSTAYIADGYGDGLRVVDTTNPANPTEIGFYKTPGSANGIFVVGSTIYVADGDNGLLVFRYPTCYQLHQGHTGSGLDPTISPANSTGCPEDEYHFLEPISLSANPAANWRVANWLGTNNDNTQSRNNTLTMPAADHQVVVNYVSTCYVLTLTHTGSGNHPTASPTNSDGCALGQYVAGQRIDLHAAPGTGYSVGNWLGTTADSSPTLDNTLNMPANDQTISVNYVLACYSLTLTHSGSGHDPLAIPAQSNDCPMGQYHYNEIINLTASAAANWQIASWSGATNNTSVSATNMLTMPPTNFTVSVNYGETPTAGPGDNYELDNTCTRSRLIAADGSEGQPHTFHAVADADWVYFTASVGVTYRIEVQVPVTSTADVNLEIYTQCDGALAGEWKASFSPGARLDFKAPADGPVYIRLANQDANLAGANVQYSMTVRALATANNNRALIIVAGRLRGADILQANINNVAKAAYTVFQHNGYTDETIYVLATDTTLPGYKAAVTRDSLHAAIITWAKSKLTTDGVLTLYMVDHGSPDLFYLDELSGQRLTPNDLTSWLTELENAVVGVKINVIIEACESGSFITQPQSISKAGRIIITSSNATDDAKASKDGAYFSDHLLTWLRQGYNLAVGFAEARTVAQNVYSLQQALIDADGNGVANEFGDSTLAARRSFAYAGTLGDDWPPYIFATQGPTTMTNANGVIQADVRDNQTVREVWAVVYPPDYTPPPPGDALQAETLPTILLSRADNGSLWKGIYTGFTQTGIYHIIVQADDNDGLKARPVTIEVQIGSHVFLPLIKR